MDMLSFNLSEAEISLNDGDYKRALAHAIEALKIDASSKLAHLFVAVCNHTLGNYDRSIAHFKECISEIKTRPDIWSMYAKSYYLLNEPKLGEKEFEKALRKYPDEAGLFVDFGYFLGKNNQHRKALNRLEKARTLTNDTDVILYLTGTCYYNTNQYNYSEVLLKQSLELNPEYYHSAQVLGHIYYNQGSYKKAIDSYSMVLYYEPENKRALYDRLLSRVSFKDENGLLYTHEAAQKDADEVKHFIDEFISIKDKDGNTLEVVDIHVSESGNLNLRVK